MLIIQPAFNHKPALAAWLSLQCYADPQRQTFIDGTSLACRASLCSTAAMIVCWKIVKLFKHTLGSVLWAPCVKSLLIIWQRVKGGMRNVRTRVRERGVFRLPCPVLFFSTHICSLTCIADVGETSGVPWDIWLWSVRGNSWRAESVCPSFILPGDTRWLSI